MSSCECHCGSEDMGLSSNTMRARLVHAKSPAVATIPTTQATLGAAQEVPAPKPASAGAPPIHGGRIAEWAALVARWDDSRRPHGGGIPAA